jgi:hypothetical protein
MGRLKIGHEMVYPDREPTAADLIHERGSRFDRLGPVQLRSLGARCSPGDVNNRSGRA